MIRKKTGAGGAPKSGDAFLTSAEKQESGPKFTPHGKRPAAGRSPAAGRPKQAVPVPSLSSSRRTIDVPLIRPMENPDEKVETRKMQVPSAEELARAWGIHQQSLHELKTKKTGGGSKGAEKTKPAHSSSSASFGPITRETLIMDVVANYPEVLPILLDVGLHCIGCTLSAYDTVQTGCELHGFDQETIDQLIKAMNGAIAQKKAEEGGAKERQGAQAGQPKKAKRDKKQRLPS